MPGLCGNRQPGRAVSLSLLLPQVAVTPTVHSSAIGWSRSWQVYRDPRWSHCYWYFMFTASSRARWVMGGRDTADVDSSF